MQLPAQARRRVEHLVELYEAQAYRTYNLALRISCDRDAAARATENAFLRHLASDQPEGQSKEDRADALLLETIAASLAETPRQPVGSKPPRDRAGDERPQKDFLGAASALSPPARAALALLSVGEKVEPTMARATGATDLAAMTLANQARRDFGAEIGVEPEQVEAKVVDWPWAEPPTEIWERVYPKAHKLLAARDGAAAPLSPGAAAAGSPLAARLLEGAPTLRRRINHRLAGRGGIWAFRAAVLVIILLPAAVVGLSRSGNESSADADLPTIGGVPVAGGDESSEDGEDYQALSPKELDQLRLQELEDLRTYSQEQVDQTLSASERSQAAEEAQRLLALARERLADANRRQQQAAAREQQSKSKAPSAGPSPSGSTGETKKKKKKKKKQQQQSEAPSSNSIESCLFDPVEGTYICQDG